MVAVSDFLLQAEVGKDVLSSVISNREYNKVIENYYTRFAHEGASVAFQSDLIYRKLKRLRSCNAYWWNDYYVNHSLKDFKKTVLCRDKNCSNCKKVKQASRMAKYIPSIEPYREWLFHFTFTVPNVDSVVLRDTTKKMASAFRKLIRILSGDRVIDGLDFDWGYEGAIRSLEITFNNSSYHPHYHVAFVFRDLFLDDDDRVEINNYSYSYGVLTRLFHEKEILIQKLWYLLYNDIDVTYDSIQLLDLGYSCTIQSFSDSDYAELFKYMTKETKEDGSVLSYDNFIALMYGTYRIKQIQGYGCFYQVTDEGDLDCLNEIYDEEMAKLRRIERPQVSYDTPEAMINDESCLYISRKNYFKYLNQILQEENRDSNNN